MLAVSQHGCLGLKLQQQREGSRTPCGSSTRGSSSSRNSVRAAASASRSELASNVKQMRASMLDSSDEKTKASVCRWGSDSMAPRTTTIHSRASPLEVACSYGLHAQGHASHRRAGCSSARLHTGRRRGHAASQARPSPWWGRACTPGSPTAPTPCPILARTPTQVFMAGLRGSNIDDSDFASSGQSMRFMEVGGWLGGRGCVCRQASRQAASCAVPPSARCHPYKP